jgi:hypothetical protein
MPQASKSRAALREATLKSRACIRCGKNASVFFTEPLCSRCFCGIIEKRLRKELSNRLERGDRVLFLEEPTWKAFESLPHVPVKAFVKPMSFFRADDFYSLLGGKRLADYVAREKIRAIVLPLTADFEAASFLEEFFSGKSMPETANGDVGIVRLFHGVSMQELGKYLKIRNLGSIRQKLPGASLFIERLEGKYRGMRAALVKSRENIRRMEGKAGKIRG